MLLFKKCFLMEFTFKVLILLFFVTVLHMLVIVLMTLYMTGEKILKTDYLILF